MPVIRYVQADGRAIDADVPLGSSVMQGAVDHFVEGIAAECGGACSCATCEVWVDAGWREAVGEACEIEREMLCAAGAECDAEAGARRLACQIEVTEALDGLIVAVPQA
jgi:ferredoxin, 2Fe-2S